MKKSLIAGVVSVALSAVPVVGVFAATTQTDNISVTVTNNCALTAAHANGANKGTWSSNTLSVTMDPGSVDYNIGKTILTITCNYASGYKVTVATTNLVNGSQSIPAYSGTAYSNSVTGWAPANGSTSSATKYKSGDVVKSQASQVSGATAEVYYGVGISGTQAAGTYTSSTNAATYTLAAL